MNCIVYRPNTSHANKVSIRHELTQKLSRPSVGNFSKPIFKYFTRHSSPKETPSSQTRNPLVVLGSDSPRKRGIVLIRRQAHPPPKRHDENRKRNAHHAESNAHGDDGLTMDKTLDPSFRVARVDDCVTTSDGANDGEFVTVNVWHYLFLIL